MSKQAKRSSKAAVRTTIPLKVWLLVFASGCLVTFSMYKFWRNAPPAPETLFEEALKLEPHDPGSSEQLLHTAIAASGGWGKYPDAEVVLSDLMAERGAWREALAIHATLDTQRCRSDRLLAFGQKALQSGTPQVGITVLRQVSQRAVPEQSKALELLLAYYRYRGDTGESIAVARELTTLHPRQLRYCWALVTLFQEAERHEDCRVAISQALECCRTKDEQVELRYALIEECVATGNLVAARKELAALEPFENGSPRWLAVTAEVYRLEGRLPEALDVINRAMAEGSAQAGMYLTRGTVLLDLGRYEEATEDLRNAVTLAPSNERAQCKLAEAYRARGDHAAAETHQRQGEDIRQKRIQLRALQKELADRPDSADLLRKVATLEKVLGRSSPGAERE